jgi:hypothetical protein
MLTLKTPAEAETFVKRQNSLRHNSNDDVRWDGWTMVFFREAPQGVYSKNGAFRNGTWGFENRVAVSEKGTWEVDYKDVKRRPKRTRN